MCQSSLYPRASGQGSGRERVGTDLESVLALRDERDSSGRYLVTREWNWRRARPGGLLH